MEKNNLVDELLKKYGSEDIVSKKNTVSHKPCRFDYFVDALEDRGVVSAADGSKPRKVIITKEEFERIVSGE